MTKNITGLYIKLWSETHLFSFDVTIAHPLAQAGPPVLHHVSLGELLSLSVSEATLCLYRGDNVDPVEVNLQPFLGLRRHLVLGAPSAAVRLRPQPVTEKQFIDAFQVNTNQ